MCVLIDFCLQRRYYTDQIKKAMFAFHVYYGAVLPVVNKVH